MVNYGTKISLKDVVKAIIADINDKNLTTSPRPAKTTPQEYFNINERGSCNGRYGGSFKGHNMKGREKKGGGHRGSLKHRTLLIILENPGTS